MIVYTAGKYTAENPELIAANVAYAKAYAIEIARAIPEIAVIVPHLLYQDDWNLGYDRYLEMDLKILSKCDAVFLLPNYKSSKGAQIEIDFCNDREIPMFESIGELKEFIKITKKLLP
jgi:hypothetical protein